MRPKCRLNLVDVAGGTGDIAFRAQKRAQRLSSDLTAHVIDANTEMVRSAAPVPRGKTCRSVF